MGDLSDYTNAVNVAAQPVLGEAMNRREYKRYLKNRDEQWAREDTVRSQLRDQALTDWEMQNRYNSPAEQRKRLEAAGLNPALMYKSGTTNQGGEIRSTPNPSSASPNMPKNEMTNPLIQAQLESINAQTQQTHQATKNMAVDNALKTLGVTYAGYKNRAGLMDAEFKEKTLQTSIQKFLDEAGLVGLDFSSEEQLFTSRKDLKDTEVSHKKQLYENSKLDKKIKEQIERLTTANADKATKDAEIFEKTGIQGSSDTANLLRILWEFLKAIQ